MGVDIGGTKIATGLVDLNCNLLAKVEVPTLAKEASEIILGQVYKSIDETIKEGHCTREDISGIGVIAPGPLNRYTGVIFHSPNIPAWRNLPLPQLLTEHYRLPAILENDANAAGLAEALFGAAVGYKYVLYVTVSTGIGTGIIIEGEIYHGRTGMAAEGGHLTINFQGPRCGCERRGCIEAYAAGPALARRAKEKMIASSHPSSKILDYTDGDIEKITPRIIARAAEEGDDFSRELIRETGEYLGIWLGGMVNVLEPDIIVIGGGVSLIGEALFNSIRETMPNYSINPFAQEIHIVPAKLQTDVGILGAAALHMPRPEIKRRT